MWFEVGSKIRIHDATYDVRNWCKSNLVLDNPEYAKKMRMGLWLGNTPAKLKLYEVIGNDIVVPFGCIKYLYGMYSPRYLFTSSIRPFERIKYDSSINLYPYQEDALKSVLEARNGILVMPCGSGKTNCGLEIIARIGAPALWLTHTQDLLNQSLSRAKSVLGVNSGFYGTITGGKVNIGRGITFATVQTLSKLDLSDYRDMWGVIIVDECHKAVGTPTKAMQFYKVLSQLSCRHKYGLTATPRRSDGMERTMTALLGDVIYEVPRSAVADTTCPVRVKTIPTGYVPNLEIALCGDGTINYAGLVDDLTHDPQRFECVLNALSALDGPTLVLANRVEYLERLQNAYDERRGGFKPSICLSSLGNSKAEKRLRKSALKALDEEEIDCVFATYQLAKEGLDVPNLRYVVFATPEKDETTVTQAAGRVARKSEGKSYGTVIDFDDNFGMLKGWLKKRQSLFAKKLNFILT